MTTYTKEGNKMATKMTATEITERINKTQEAIRKLTALIEKREKDLPKAQKKLAGLDKETQRNEWWDVHMKVYNLEDGIKGGKQKLEDKQKTLKKWQAKLEEVNAEAKILREIPEQLKQLQEQVTQELIKSEKWYREVMITDKSEMTHEEFFKKYSWREYYKYYYITDEEIEKECRKESKYWVLGLIRRTEEKVGEITRWHLWLAERCLNGWVEGTKGNATIETIYAGGWNIQCLHTRVLVK